MKVHLACESKQKRGGGFSFQSNFSTMLARSNNPEVSWRDADIVLIPGSSMITKEFFREMKDAGKKIVLRVDNVPRNSRNRNTGTSRLKMMADGADGVIYQSEWAKDYLKPFLKKDGPIIYNSTDETVFTEKGTCLDFRGKGENIYLYSRYSRDETKRWEDAWWEYQQIQRSDPTAFLVIIGRFSDALRQAEFDFFMNEKFSYMGIINTPQDMAKLLRGVNYLMATYARDCFSQTYLEALMCGVKLYKPHMSGGVPEMLELFEKKGREYFYLKRMYDEYLNYFESIV